MLANASAAAFLTRTASAPRAVTPCPLRAHRYDDAPQHRTSKARRAARLFTRVGASALGWRLGSERDPEITRQGVQLQNWVTIVLNIYGVDQGKCRTTWANTRLAIEPLDAKQRWSWAKGILFSDVVLLLDAGWAPLLPVNWRTQQVSQP